MRISKKNLQFYLISLIGIITLFRPRIVNYYEGISSFYYFFQIILVLFVSLIIFNKLVKKGLKGLSVVSYAVIIYKLYELVAVYQNGLLDSTTLINAGIIISSTVLTEYLIENVPGAFLGILCVYSGIMVFINNVSFYMGGVSNTDATGNIVYFWQTRNHLSSLFFIAFISTLLKYGIKRNRFFRVWTVFVFINILSGIIIFNSSTTIVGFAVMILFYFLLKRNILCKPVMWFAASLALNFAIIVLRVQRIFSWLIENWLHKSLTFTGRTSIWDMALAYIVRRPLFGYGESAVFDFSWSSSEVVAHNQFLDVAIICGIPGMILFIVVLFIVFKQLEKYKDSAVARLLLCALFGYMIMTITESPNPYQPWFIIFALAFKIPEIDALYKDVTYSFSGGVLRQNIK